MMRQMVLKQLSRGTYGDEVLNAFIDYVSYLPNLYCFSKVKFVAAVRYLISVHKPHIAQQYFKDKMPGA